MLTYAIQRVGDDLPLEPQGATDFIAFREAVDAFPWAAEHAQWDEVQQGPLPALVLQDALAERELWVTPLGDGTDLSGAYLLQSVSMQFRKGFFGKGKRVQDVTLADAPRRVDADRFCELFCDGQYGALDRLVADMRSRDD